jgi:hypothetical protein
LVKTPRSFAHVIFPEFAICGVQPPPTDRTDQILCILPLSSTNMAGLPPFDLDKKFHLSQVPHPSWTQKDPQPRSENDVKKVALNPQEIGPGNSYKLLIGGVVPRPIAFVSTRSKTGLLNLAPFSFFNVVCNDPPTVAISIAMAGGQQKDTATNILESGEFVVNIISEWFAE